MPHNYSPYIDGNRGQVFRTVNGTGTNVDPHTNVVAPHDSYVYDDGSNKYLRTDMQRFIQFNETKTIVVGSNILGAIDTRKLKGLTLKIVSTGVALNDFVVLVNQDITINTTWDDLAFTDAHYTSAQGESLNNTMTLVRKCFPNNPRTLAANASTSLILNVEPHAATAFRINATSAGTIKTYYYGLFN